MQTTSNYLRLTKKQFRIVDSLCLASKNLYNYGMYMTRQYYFKNDKFLPYESNYHYCKDNENYKTMFSSTGQQTLKVVDRSFKSFFGLLRARKDGNYNCTISIPHYLPKNGRFPLIYQMFAVHGNTVTLGMSVGYKKQYDLTGKELTFKIPPYIVPSSLKEIRVIPVHGGKTYKIEYVYNVEPEQNNLEDMEYLSIDLGLDNFATFVNSVDGAAAIIDGKHIKSLNRFYNKEMSRLQSAKDKQGMKKVFTRKQSRLTIKRNNQLNEFLNRAVCHIVNVCLEKHIGNVAVGGLTEIKHEINHGHVNNQNFVGIPYFMFRRKLKGKCERYGIIYHEVDEAYTSRTDALAFDEIKEQPYGKSRRIERGLYKSITGVAINADVNGALNILRKVASKSAAKRIAGSGLVNRPARIRLSYESKLLTNQIANATALASPAL